jgi:hypothetical protein
MQIEALFMASAIIESKATFADVLTLVKHWEPTKLLIETRGEGDSWIRAAYGHTLGSLGGKDLRPASLGISISTVAELPGRLLFFPPE